MPLLPLNTPDPGAEGLSLITALDLKLRKAGPGTVARPQRASAQSDTPINLQPGARRDCFIFELMLGCPQTEL